MKRVVMLLDNSFKADARVEKEAIALIKEGYEVVVLCTEENGLPDSENRNGIVITRCLKEGYNAPLRKGYRSYLENMASVVLDRSPDILHCHDFYMLSIGAIVKKKMPSVYLIYDAHEFLKGWPFYKTSTGLNRIRGKIVYNALLKKERKEMKLADQVITITEGISKRFQKWAGLSNQPIVIGNYPEVVTISKDPSYFRLIYPISDEKKIIVHSGTIYHSNNELKHLFDTVSVTSNYALVFIGNRPRFNEIKMMVQGNDSWKKSIFFHDYPPDQSSTIQLIAHADLGLLFIKDKWIAHKIGFSNRFVEYIMAGLPVIGISQEFSASMNEKYKTSIFYNSKDRFGLQNVLLKMNENFEILSQNAQEARKELSWSNEVQKLINHYTSI